MEYSYKMISELGRVVTGKTPLTENEEYFGGSYPFITPSDIHSYDEKYLSETERTVSEDGARILKGMRLPPQSICFVCIGSTIGKMCMTNTLSYSNQQINTLIPNKEYDCEYIFYYLRYVKSYFQSIGGGTGSGKGIVNKSLFSKTKLSVLEGKTNQQRIGAILSAYDNLIEVNNKRIKVLEQMAENLYKEWFVRFRFPGHETAEFENGLPKGWEYKRAEEAIIFNPTLNIGNQKQFTIIPMEALSTTSMVLDSSCFVVQDSISGRRSQNGDTLLAKITPCLENGKTGFVMGMPDGDVLGGSTEFVVMRSKTLTPYYVYCIARSEFFRQTAILSMNGADGRQRVDEDKLKATKILHPDKATLDRFDAMIRPIFDNVYQMVQKNKNLIKQRDLLLPRLMSGKLEV